MISTRSKSGTTWLQWICALLIHRTPDLPQPLADLSPWLDWQVNPLDEVLASLDAQPGPRIIKTHTPLDGVPIAPHVHYIVGARHPIDAAVSLWHQGANLDRQRIAALVGANGGEGPAPSSRPELSDWLLDWMEWDGDIGDRLDSMQGFFWHLTDAWQRLTQPNVTMVHYDDLVGGLPAEMRRIATMIGVDVGTDELETLAGFARFDWMRDHSDKLAPDPVGILKDHRAFFRRGQSGERAEVLAERDLIRYDDLARAALPLDLMHWLHH